MNKEKFTIDINASKSKVWKTLWDDETYRKWTSAFAEGSSAETDWKEGSTVRFHDGKGNGMISRIEKNIPLEQMSIKHLGEIKDGVEDTTSEAVSTWSGAMEEYRLTEKNGVTTVKVEMDMNEQWKEFFNEVWPKALAKLKELAEAK